MAKYKLPTALIFCTTKEHVIKDTGKLWSLLSVTEGFGLRVSYDRDVMYASQACMYIITSCLSKTKVS